MSAPSPPACSDPEVYDRFLNIGYASDGNLVFAACRTTFRDTGRMIEAFSISMGSCGRAVQSHRNPISPRDPSAVLELREESGRELSLRTIGGPAEMKADLRFHADTAIVEEPYSARRPPGSVMTDVPIAVQFGRWHGRVAVGGEEAVFRAETVLGIRERSWGVTSDGGDRPSTAQHDWLCAYLRGRGWGGYGAVLRRAGATCYEAGALAPEAADPRATEVPGHRPLEASSVRVSALAGDPNAPAEVYLTFPAAQHVEARLQPIRSLELGALWATPAPGGESGTVVSRWRADRQPPDGEGHYLHVCRAEGRPAIGTGLLERLVRGAGRTSP